MFLTLTVIFVVVSCTLLVTRINRKKDRDELQLHSITPEALHTLMASNPGTLLFDVRQPLDLLGHSAIIPGAKWIPPQELLKNPSLIPQEKDAVVYCTCPGDKTSRAVLHQAQAMHFSRIKIPEGWIGRLEGEGLSCRAVQRTLSSRQCNLAPWVDFLSQQQNYATECNFLYLTKSCGQSRSL